MPNNAEKFLDAYREYETVLRTKGLDYKTVEDGADDITQNRMRINRQMRNYLTHQHDAGFLAISDKQIAYLKKSTTELKQSMDILKKHIKSARVAGCTRRDLLEDVLAKMMKLKVFALPLYGDDGIEGILTWLDVTKVHLAAKRPKTAKIGDMKVSKIEPVTMRPDALMAAVFDSGANIVCCTDTGEPDGKFIGAWFSPNA